MLDREAHTGARSERVGLVCLAMVLLAFAFSSENVLWRDTSLDPTLTARQRIGAATFSVLFSGIGLLLIIVSALRRLPARAGRYAFFAVILTLGLDFTSILASSPAYGVDNAAAPPFAAELLLAGRNPYQDFVLSEAAARFNLPEGFVTRLIDGTPWDLYVYPAGSFLTVAPLIAAGLADVRPLYGACFLGVVILLYSRVDRRDRALLLAAAMVYYVLNRIQFVLGVQEPLWGLAVVASWFARRQIVLAAVLLGYAATVKQLGGLFVPFYAVYVWRSQGPRQAALALLVPAALFVATNLPFLLGAPGRWLTGVLGLTVTPLPVMGIGPASLGAELWPVVPQSLYTGLALIALIGGLGWFAVTPKPTPRLAWLLPLVPLWFAWRSVSNYFYLVPLLALAVSIGGDPPAAEKADEPRAPRPGSDGS